MRQSEVVRLLVVPGSTRAGAFSKHLARAAGALAIAAGHAATVVDLRDHPMPLYDADLEEREGLPAEALRLRELALQHDAFVFATPEYNASLPAVLKNALDWLSRPPKATPGTVFQGKVAGLLGSSPGALGGLRALVHLRQVLMNLGALVVTEQFALGNAATAFAADGSLADERQRQAVDRIVRRVAAVAAALQPRA